jgi:hypothetical protein
MTKMKCLPDAKTAEEIEKAELFCQKMLKVTKIVTSTFFELHNLNVKLHLVPFFNNFDTRCNIGIIVEFIESKGSNRFFSIDVFHDHCYVWHDENDWSQTFVEDDETKKVEDYLYLINNNLVKFNSEKKTISDRKRLIEVEEHLCEMFDKISELNLDIHLFPFFDTAETEINEENINVGEKVKINFELFDNDTKFVCHHNIFQINMALYLDELDFRVKNFPQNCRKEDIMFNETRDFRTIKECTRYDSQGRDNLDYCHKIH